MLKKYFSVVLYFLSGLLVIFALGYTFLKAKNSSFTHDESYTYTRYVNTSVWDIAEFNRHDIPNNHILNTLLMKFSQALFGSSELALRLPNLLAFFFYVVLVIVWLRQLSYPDFKQPWLFFTGIVVLIINPYLLDFFSMARGYGLSVSFMFASFYFFMQHVSSLRGKHLFLSFLFAALAVWSNFTLLNYYLALLATYNVYLVAATYEPGLKFSLRWKGLIAGNKIPFRISLVMVVLLLRPIMNITGDLFGPDTAFWKNTVRSIINCSIHPSLNWTIDSLSIFAAIIMAASFVTFAVHLWKSHLRFSESPYLLAILLAVFAAYATVFQHLIFKVPFLENRTGLFFIVLFQVIFILFLNILATKTRLSVMPAVLGCSLALFLLYNMKAGTELYVYREWRYDSCTKLMIDELEKDRAQTTPVRNNVSMGISWVFEPAINFYRETRHLNWFKEVNRDGYIGDFDYYYIENDTGYVAHNNKIVVKEFPEIQTVLAKSRREEVGSQQSGTTGE
jgi:hypothetical protein